MIKSFLEDYDEYVLDLSKVDMEEKSSGSDGYSHVGGQPTIHIRKPRDKPANADTKKELSHGRVELFSQGAVIGGMTESW